MIALDAANVRLGSRPDSKEDAIRAVAGLLADSGHVDPAYAESMLGREAVANTYLGEGLAIPHGMLQDREQIHHTGIAVLQVPGGVEWNPGETVRLVVGIAAASDEHLEILANLTQVLAEPGAIDALARTTDAHDIVERLTRAPGAAPPAGEDLEGFAVAEAVVPGTAGLHARPATVLVDVAKGFAADVRVGAGGRSVNGKSLAALLGLGAGPGERLVLYAQGPDQDEALAALKQAVDDGLGEGEEEEHAETIATGPSWAPGGTATGVPGVAASPGIAIGPIHHFKSRKLVVERTAKDPAAEERRLRGAMESGRAELRDLYDAVRAKSGAGQAAIFRAHEGFLDDPDLSDQALAGIRDGQSAGWAWREAYSARAAGLAKLEDPLLAGRAVDLDDVGERVLRYLAEADERGAELPEHPVILIAEDLTPSDTAAIDPARVVGFGTAIGGPTSHTAIIARALGIPAIVGAGPALLDVAGDAVLDGSGGMLWLDLAEADVASAREAQEELADVRAAEHRTRYEPAIMRDGHRVEVAANANLPQETVAAVEAGAEGIGLMRTEFLFLGRETAPTEDEQFAALKGMVEALNGLPLIVRTLDIGGDKTAPYIEVADEDNPFLGVRGIRLCLAKPELFEPQLRAIYRASKLGPVSMMFPMVARVEELDEALEYAERAREAVGAEPIDVGIMIEVPSAVALAPELARKVAFFSVGTNDLTQYVLAMDRMHPGLAKHADALHPAVLRMIKQVVDAANANDAWVGVCGGVAGEPEGALILSGLGVRELSVSVPAVAAVKARLRRLDRKRLEALSAEALACSTATEVRRLRFP